MRLAQIVATSARVAGTSGRLAKVDFLATLLGRLASDEIEIAIGFLPGKLRQGRNGVGYAALRAARPDAPAGEATLELREVDTALQRIAGLSGKGSTSAKARLLRVLFERATEDEHRILVGLVLGELRQGALVGLMVEAVARAAGQPSATVSRAVMTAGDLPAVARVLLTEGEAGLARFTLRLFRPILPMLAQPIEDAHAAIEHLGEAALEYKLDGARIQIHKGGDLVRVFSRRLREVTPAVPELVERARALPLRDLILDGEVIALRPDGRPHPFQVTMRRFGRKLDVDRVRSELPLKPFLFDVLYADGQDLTNETFSRRSALLRTCTRPDALIPQTVARTPEAAAAFLEEALRRGHEGLMAKALDAGYEAGARGSAWLKIKPAHRLDLVILAAEWGHGRRRGWLSNLHLGAGDPRSGGFVMLGKTFKGMTDEMLAWQTERLLQAEIGRDRYTVYVRPELVVEVAFNGVQASPQYPAGLALRFARVKRYRPDKGPADVDTIDAVRLVSEGNAGPAPSVPEGVEG